MVGLGKLSCLNLASLRLRATAQDSLPQPSFLPTRSSCLSGVANTTCVKVPHCSRLTSQLLTGILSTCHTLETSRSKVIILPAKTYVQQKLKAHAPVSSATLLPRSPDKNCQTSASPLMLKICSQAFNRLKKRLSEQKAVKKQ